MDKWQKAAQIVKERTEKKIRDISAAGAEQTVLLSMTKDEPPRAEVGIFADGAEPWAADTLYNRYDLFSHNGAMGYVKQAHTSQAVYPPFTTGTEALYGARPAPDESGVYPYVYNMAASVGMRVRNNGVVWQCIQAIGDMLYPPEQLPAHFEEAME